MGSPLASNERTSTNAAPLFLLGFETLCTSTRPWPGPSNVISVRSWPDEIRRGDVAEIGRRRGNWVEVIVEGDEWGWTGSGGVFLVAGKGEGVGGRRSIGEEFGEEEGVEGRWRKSVGLTLGA